MHSVGVFVCVCVERTLARCVGHHKEVTQSPLTNLVAPANSVRPSESSPCQNLCLSLKVAIEHGLRVWCVLCVRGCGVWSGVWMWPISVWCALNLCTVSWVGQSQMLKFENGQKTTISQRFTPSPLTPHTNTHTSNKSGQCELLTESATAFVVALLLLLSCCRCYSVYGQRPVQFHSIQLVCVCLSCEAQKYAAYFQAAVEKVRMRFMPGNKNS